MGNGELGMIVYICTFALAHLRNVPVLRDIQSSCPTEHRVPLNPRIPLYLPFSGKIHHLLVMKTGVLTEKLSNEKISRPTYPYPREGPRASWGTSTSRWAGASSTLA